MTTLGIIGIIVGSLAGVLLFFAALLLFAPVGYDMRASKHEGAARLIFKVSWLFGVLSLGYDGKRFWMNILWLFRLGKKKRRRRSAKTKAKAKTKASAPKDLCAEDKGSVVKEIWGIEDKGVILGYLGVLLKRWLRVLRPRRFSLGAEIGLPCPAQTGVCLGILGIISGMWQIPIDIYGNFSKETLKFDLYVRDRFMPWSFAWPLAAFCLRRPVWKLIKKYVFGKDGHDESKSESKF